MSCPQTSLTSQLLASYDRGIVPTASINEPVNVKIDVTVDHIIDLDEKHQIIHTALWVRLKWTDPTLRWNLTGQFENVRHVTFDFEEIWVPDVVVYNEIGLETGRNVKRFRVEAAHDGSMRWAYPRSLVTACPLNSKRFPYDTQTCNITFGSWIYASDKLQLFNEKVSGDDSEFRDRNEWHMKNFTVYRQVTLYECCPHSYAVIHFNVELERAYGYYIFNMIFPCILISLVNVFGFLLPVPSGERISLNITAFLGLVVFMIIVSEMMPPQADVIPNISVYFGCCLTLIALANLLNIFIVHLHFRGSHGSVMSPFIRWWFVHKLGRALCYGHLIKHAHIIEGNDTIRNMIEHVTEEGLANPGGRRPSINPDDQFGTQSLNIACYTRQNSLPVDTVDTIAHGRRGSDSGRGSDGGRGSNGSLKFKDTQIKPKVRRSKSTEWKVLAVVLDRLLFIVILIITVVNNMCILLS